MDRRDLLARFGAVAGVASLGGCLARYEDVVEGPGETTGEVTTTGETATGDGGTASARRPTLTGRRFELSDSGCGEPRSEAGVRFREGEATVVVTGTIPGSNSCYVAELVDAGYDPDDGAFVATVTSTRQEGSEACAECIVEIDYEATFTFEDGVPERVEVVHEAMGESETVAAVRSGGTADRSVETTTRSD